MKKNTPLRMPLARKANVQHLLAGLAVLILCLVAAIGHSLTGATPAYVDFDSYERLVAEVKTHRKTHLLGTAAFKEMSTQQKVIVLDTRSDSMYALVHIKGAVHLNFADFTQANLARIIPSPDYKILIYCNNNFNITDVNDARFINKQVFARSMATKAIMMPVKTQHKATKSPTQNNEGTAPVTGSTLTLALNIPTYINLYGYGYKNVYELADLVNTNDRLIEFEGTAVVN